MRIVYFGSGTFGLPTLRALVKRHEVALVITQPDRPAGRGRKPKPSPIGEFAGTRGLPILKPEHVNDPEVVRTIRAVASDVFIVIAYGQKLGRDLLVDRFAINLHGSLLPKYRGAAPVNWAIINRERETGLSVITLAERMDAGEILGQTVTAIDPHETAGELHDRLAALGPELVETVLERFDSGTLTRDTQDESQVLLAPKLKKSDGTTRFDRPAAEVRARIHGLTPWPGCRVMTMVGGEGDGSARGEAAGEVLRLHRARVVSREATAEPPGVLLDAELGDVACKPGVLRLLAVHPPGGKLISFAAYACGRQFEAGTLLRPLEQEVAPE